MSEPPGYGKYRRGDRIRFTEETIFRGDEGEVAEDQQAPGSVRVVVKIFGREVQLEVEERLLEKLE
jgi:transcription antitermination factor NusG